MKQFIRDVFDRELLVHLTQVGLVLFVIFIVACGLAYLESKGW